MKKFLAMALCCAMAFTMAACGSSASSTAASSTATSTASTAASGSSTATSTTGTPAHKKDLIIGTAQDINQLNPLLQNDQINNNCIALSHQTLVSLDNVTNEKKPSLAEKWEWTDDTHLVFHLYKNVTFSNGTKMTAADVVFTYERAMSTDPTVSAVAGNLKLITKVEATDDYTVTLTTTKFSNELIDMLMSKPMSILSKAAFDDTSNKEPWLIGTGQYVFSEWKQGEYVKYVKNEKYWGDDPGVADEIIFKPILEASARVIALQNGEIDVCIDPPANELQYLQSDSNVTVYTQAGTRLFYLSFNTAKAPFDNQTLRQAVSCAIDKDKIVKVVLDGRGKTQYSILNRGVWSFLDNDALPKAYTYDLDKAKTLLEKAGYKSGDLTVDMYIPNVDPYTTIAPIVQANLKDLGITVNIVQEDQATMKTDCAAGKQQLFLWRWNVLTRLDETYRELFYTDYPTNYAHYSDKYVDEMADKILVEKDKDKRLEESHELQTYMAETVPQVPLYVPDLVIAYNKNLQGTYLFGGGNHWWAHAYVAE